MVFFLITFLSFLNNVFFLGFCLLLISLFYFLLIWFCISQWLSLIFFLVFVRGVIVVFIFFCSFTRTVGGLIFKVIFPLRFFVLFGFFNIEIISFDKKSLTESSCFYSLRELPQLFFLGMWMIYVLWISLKILSSVGRKIR